MKKYPCDLCKQLHRRNALTLIHRELLCRKCMLNEYPYLKIKKTPQKGLKWLRKANKTGDEDD